MDFSTVSKLFQVSAFSKDVYQPSEVSWKKTRFQFITILSLGFLWLLLLPDTWFFWLICCAPILFILILLWILAENERRLNKKKEIAKDFASKRISEDHKKEWTRPCLNCNSDFYAYVSSNRKPSICCGVCEKICKSCGENSENVNRNRSYTSSWYCWKCSSKMETTLNKHKTILFRRPQIQVNERKITDKEKQDCWERDQSPDDYYYWCDTIMHHNDDSMCSFTKMQESLGNSEENLRKLRKAAFEMEIDFYRTVNPEPMVVLRCKECAIYQELATGNIETTKEKHRSRHITEQVKNAVWRRDEGKCVQCGSNESLEFDHIIPHSKGGANTKRNIQLLCESCNRKKSDKI
jgi:hypothetical protein